MTTDPRYTEAWQEALPLYVARFADDELRAAIDVRAPDEFLCRMMSAIDEVGKPTTTEARAIMLHLLFWTPL